ncbi:MAG TPA: LPS export ABC transporter permease LptF [Candidatus Margulisiibacteriota bacterium]|nr:LPS export ABC transporter permease LptF [Candidatus Margulisiibacteriota bacterium]
MSILSRYTIKEILSHLAGVLVLVVAVFMVRHFAEFLGDAAEGDLPSAVILRLLGLRTVMALPSLLPAALYIGALLALGRLSDDNELTALGACGVSPGRIYATVVAFGVFAAAIAAALSFWARPWAAVAFHTLRDTAMKQAGISQLGPGRFYQLSAGSEQAVFAEDRSATDPDAVENVFVQQRDADGISVLWAARATDAVDLQRGYRFLRLFDGYRYDLGSDAKNVQITQYAELVIRTPLAGRLGDSGQNHALSALDLARSANPEDAAELQWRIASPVSAFLLLLLAIPLSQIGPRWGQYTKLFSAIGLYLVYGELLSMVKKWVANGVWPSLPGTWIVHALCLATALVLLWAPRLAQLGTLARTGASISPHAGPHGVR